MGSRYRSLGIHREPVQLVRCEQVWLGWWLCEGARGNFPRALVSFRLVPATGRVA